jgi:hypothetical protein
VDDPFISDAAGDARGGVACSAEDESAERSAEVED